MLLRNLGLPSAFGVGGVVVIVSPHSARDGVGGSGECFFEPILFCRVSMMRLVFTRSIGFTLALAPAIFAGAAAHSDIRQLAQGTTTQALEFVLADLVFDNPAALANANIPSRTSRAYVVAVAGAAESPAVGSCGSRFRKGAKAPTGTWGEVLNIASGVYWTPVYSSSPVKTCDFGTVGDAAYL